MGIIENGQIDCCSCHISPPCGYCVNKDRCDECDGTGQFFVCRDRSGNIDYIDGSKTGETIDCDACQGSGLKE